MYKIMIIDDDLPFLKYLTQCMDWSSLQLELCGSTVSSIKAMQLFEQHLPDFVLLDIGLPQIDGLALAEAFRKMKPTLRIIFLTCHEDFHYVKRALQLSADEYLIKDAMTESQLSTALVKTVNLIKTTVEVPVLYHRETVLKNMDVLKQSLLNDLLSGKSTEYMRDAFKRLDIEWPYSHFITGIISLGYTSDKTFNISQRDLSLIHYGMHNIFEDTFAKHAHIIGFMCPTEPSIYFIINTRKSLQVSAFDSIMDTMEQYQQHLKHYLNMDVYTYLYQHYFEFHELSHAVNELNKAKQNHFYDETRNHILPYPPQKSYYIHSAELIGKYSVSKLVGEDVDKKVLHAIIESGAIAQKHRLAPQLLRAHWLALYRLTGGTQDDYAEQCIQRGSKYNEILNVIQRMIELKIKDNQTTNLHTLPKIKEIDDYIMQHLSEHITAVDMANFLFLNPSYFSRYFKKLSGKTFSDYMNEFKINLAKQMLVEYDETNSMIAQRLGYSDRTYFSKVFKKYTGFSPVDYKLMNHQSK